MTTEQLVETNVNLSDYYSPHAGQRPIHQSVSQNKWLEMARRFGKSRSAFGEFLKAYQDAMVLPVDNSMVPPFHAWIAVPSFPQSNQVWNELMSLIPPAFIYRTNQDDRTIYLRGSQVRPWGLLEVKSCHNPEALQTAGLDFLWVTESQDIANKAFEKLLPTLRSPGRMSRAVFEGIPSLYSDHWFRRGCAAASDGRENHAYFHATVYDNPTLSPEDVAEVEGDKDLLPIRVWERMYLANFNEDAGYFNNVSRCIAGDLLPEALPGAEYVGGLDLGRKVDASVLTVMDAKERRVVFHHRWDDSENWVLQRDSIVRIANEWGLSRVMVDATGMGGDMFMSEMLEAGVPAEPFIFTQASRESILQDLSVAMERESIRFPQIDALLRELRAFQVRKLPSGRPKAEAPPGEHDDEVFALALALNCCAPAPTTDTGMRSRRMGGRYAPTQNEANNNQVPSGAQKSAQRYARERILDKIRDRQDQLQLL